MDYRCHACGDKLSVASLERQRSGSKICGAGTHRGPFTPLSDQFATRTRPENVETRKAVDE